MYTLEAMISRIKDIKKAQKLSNEALAELSGVPKGTLAKILGSETKDPQISSIIKISQALNVSADYIIFGKEDTLHQNEFNTLFSMLSAKGQEKTVTYMKDLIASGHSTKSISSDIIETLQHNENTVLGFPINVK